MKKTPLIVIHRMFSVASLAVLGGFLGFLVYLYLAFSGPLIGDINVQVAPDLLYKLDSRKLQTAVARMQTRANLPDIPANLPDPYKAAPAP